MEKPVLDDLFGAGKQVGSPPIDDLFVQGKSVNQRKFTKGPISLRDIPHIAARGFSDYYGGVPELAARNPISGIPGAMARKGVEIMGSGNLLPKEPNLFPQPATPQGKLAGDVAGIISMFLPGGLAGETGARAINTGKQMAEKAAKIGAEEIPVGINRMKREGLKQMVSRSSVISGLENVTTRMAKKEADALKNTIREEGKNAIVQLNQAAREGALQAQKALPQYFSKRSREYGKALDEIMARAELNSPGVPANELAEKLGKVAQDLGIDYAGVQSPLEQEIVALATKYGQKAADPREGKFVRFDELIGVKKRIENMVSAAKQSGSQAYGAGEHSLSSFREGMGELMEKYLDGLKELNKSYAPFIKLKKQAVGVFKPFSGGLQTKTAEALLKRSGLPRAMGGAEEALIRQLEQETGSAFAEGSRRAGTRIEGLKDARRIGLDAIKNKEQQRLIELAARKRKVSRNIGETILEGARKAYKFGSGRII